MCVCVCVCVCVCGFVCACVCVCACCITSFNCNLLENVSGFDDSLVCIAKAYCIDYLTGKVSRLLVDP